MPNPPSRADLQKLPQSLLSFKYTSHRDAVIPLELFSAFPPKLRYFDNCQVLPLEASTKLPLELRELNMKWLPQMATAAHIVIPSRLTTLQVQFLGDDREVDLAWLPTTLTKLVLQSSRPNPQGPQAVRLPASLTSLEHKTGQSLEGEWPESLTHLKVSGPTSFGENAVLALPKTLLTLAVYTFHARDALSLSSNLTELRVDCLMEELTDPLPRTLTSLYAYHGVLTTAYVATLPASLSSITVRQLDDAGVNLKLAECVWPRSLTELVLLSYDVTLTLDDVLALPRSLITFASKCNVPGEILVGFPRGLRTLEMANIIALDSPIGDFNRYVGDLPPRLKRLTVAEGFLGPANAKHLPRTLTDATILRLAPTAATYHLLPVGLASFQFDKNYRCEDDYRAWKGPFDPKSRKPGHPARKGDSASSADASSSGDFCNIS